MLKVLTAVLVEALNETQDTQVYPKYAYCCIHSQLRKEQEQACAGAANVAGAIQGGYDRLT
jgi:hypothetical protein